MAKHARPEPRRRWFGLRAPAAPEPEPVVDLREVVVLADDPESVLARMTRLRDAGLITTAELEAERRRILAASAREH